MHFHIVLNLGPGPCCLKCCMALSEGATRGSGHLREAVTQLRGEAGERQVPDARTALIGCGGFFFNSQGAILRRL